jgi:hypothetical protein
MCKPFFDHLHENHVWVIEEDYWDVVQEEEEDCCHAVQEEEE